MLGWTESCSSCIGIHQFLKASTHSYTLLHIESAFFCAFLEVTHPPTIKIKWLQFYFRVQTYKSATIWHLLPFQSCMPSIRQYQNLVYECIHLMQKFEMPVSWTIVHLGYFLKSPHTFNLYVLIKRDKHWSFWSGAKTDKCTVLTKET